MPVHFHPNLDQAGLCVGKAVNYVSNKDPLKLKNYNNRCTTLRDWLCRYHRWMLPDVGDVIGILLISGCWY